MSKKTDLKKAIEDSEKEIESLEKKRLRSQTALLESFLDQTAPSETDAEYFRVYSSLIKLERENLQKLKEELDKLNGTK